MDDQDIKRYTVLTVAAGLSAWAIDMAATLVTYLVALQLPKLPAAPYTPPAQVSAEPMAE
jgi:hypothetical protein